MSNKCEISDCGRDANSTTNGIRTCERCRREFVSAGAGAVYFSGRWHGVIGAIGSDFVANPYSGSWARKSRD